MKEDIKYEWDGETIKQSIQVPDKKITPMEMLNHIDRLNAEINQMEAQKGQHESALENIKKALVNSKETLEKWKPFEGECEKLQFEKLEKIVELIKNECIEKAVKATDKEVEDNPHEMTEEQIKNSRYVKFRMNITQHPKVVNKICKRIITKHLYEKPFFSNPFEIDDTPDTGHPE